MYNHCTFINFASTVKKFHVKFSSVQLLSCVTLRDHMDCSIPDCPVPHQLLEFAQTHIHWVFVMPFNHLILCCPFSCCLQYFPASNESVLHIRWPKYCSFSFRISPSNEYSGLISFRIDWLDILAVQGTLKSLFQHHSSKVSIPGTQLSLWSNSHIHSWLLQKPQPWLDGPLSAK